MMASPMFSSQTYSPQRGSDEHPQYRPAKNLEAFNSLLPPAVEFVEGSSSGALAIAEGKYEPINGSPKAQRSQAEVSFFNTVPVNGKPKNNSSTSPKSPAIQPLASTTSLYSHHIDSTWPASFDLGAGLFNTGNTCFLNSALQCLLHTAPLFRMLVAHSEKDPLKNGTFCMSCSLRQVLKDSFRRGRAFTPLAITKNLSSIAKHLRRGRQEDSHEFLRYAIDALQKSCLAGLPPKIDPKLAETTWVHRIFGGRLRSRVTCSRCGHNSDTFDSILDLSIDIYGVFELKEALRKFTTIDYLKGADKYKCEKCKRAVNAEKQFTIHEAPVVLTVHFKRFTPLGRKLAHPVKYQERLHLQPAMSEGQFGPTYSLYGVISHAGGGPNSGHYYAHVKSGSGRWYEMNDEMVEPARVPPVSLKNAYILFYVREGGQKLEAALNGSIYTAQRNGLLVNGMAKKRKVILSDDEEDQNDEKGQPLSKPFIGPVMPPGMGQSNGDTSSASAITPHKPSPVHPETAALKKKIAEAERRQQPKQSPRKALVDYEDDEEEGEVVQRTPIPTPSSPQKSPPPHPPTSPLPPSSPLTSGVPTSSFYGSSEPRLLKKRKSPDRDSLDFQTNRDSSASYRSQSEFKSSGSSQPNRTISNATQASSSTKRPSGTNPFNRITGSDNFDKKQEEVMFRPQKLHKKYGGKNARRIMM
ncbi:cysteine proteinase [Rickenella mellea]|uniref:Ubiquitin carboxyl-terminal hydrolase n=1 Tax=Rickenella mellea TaxID=50990 RepID=A0A4V6PN30_9AGAM|nr:cysteine proteinase [Rickenella mellea]